MHSSPAAQVQLLLLGQPQKGRVGRQSRGIAQALRQLCKALWGAAQEAPDIARHQQQW